MGRSGALAVGAILAGLVAALAALASAPAPGPAAEAAAEETAPTSGADGPERCRTITVPDAECTAAWEEKRRRFFGSKE